MARLRVLLRALKRAWQWGILGSFYIAIMLIYSHIYCWCFYSSASLELMSMKAESLTHSESTSDDACVFILSDRTLRLLADPTFLGWLFIVSSIPWLQITDFFIQKDVLRMLLISASSCCQGESGREFLSANWEDWRFWRIGTYLHSSWCGKAGSL